MYMYTVLFIVSIIFIIYMKIIDQFKLWEMNCEGMGLCIFYAADFNNWAFTILSNNLLS